MPRAIPSRSRDASRATSRVESSRRASRAASARVTATASALDASEDRNNASAPNRARSSITTGSPSASRSTRATCARDATGNVAVVAAVPAPVATARAPLAAVSETAVAPAASDETSALRAVPMCLAAPDDERRLVRASTRPRRARGVVRVGHAGAHRGGTRRRRGGVDAPQTRHACSVGRAQDRGREASRERVQTSQKNPSVASKRDGETEKTSRFVRGCAVRRQEKRRTRSTFPWRRRARAPPRGASRESLSSRSRRVRERAPSRAADTRRRASTSRGTRRVVAKVDARTRVRSRRSYPRGALSAPPRLPESPRLRRLSQTSRRATTTSSREPTATMGCSASKSPALALRGRGDGGPRLARARARPGRRAHCGARASGDPRGRPTRGTSREASRPTGARAETRRGRPRASPRSRRREGTCTSGTGTTPPWCGAAPRPRLPRGRARLLAVVLARARDAGRAELGPDVEWRLFWDRAGDARPRRRTPCTSSAAAANGGVSRATPSGARERGSPAPVPNAPRCDTRPAGPTRCMRVSASRCSPGRTRRSTERTRPAKTVRRRATTFRIQRVPG